MKDEFETRQLKVGQVYYIPDYKSEYAESKMQVWQGSDQDYKYLNSNNVHLNSDDARFKGLKLKENLENGRRLMTGLGQINLYF